MNITFNFKNFEPSEHLKEYARGRFDKLNKFIGEEGPSEIQVNLSVEKFRQMADVIFVQGNIHLSAYHESEDMYATIDLVLDKMEAQVKRIRERVKEKRRAKRTEEALSARMDVISFSETEGGERERTIVERDHFEPKPMDVEEAAMQLDSLKYEFLVFLNSETEQINVIYRRKNDDFGLIIPNA